MKRIILIAALCACTPAATPIILSQVPTDIAADIGCFVAEALAGTQSVPQMFAQCGELSAAQAAALLAALAQGGGIAVKVGSSPTIHVPIVTLTDAQRTRLAQLQSQVAGAQ
jgi:hypothetical protein